MNSELQEFARKSILDGLKLLPESSQELFKRMYSPQDHTLPIEEVVGKMPEDKLDWAMQQVKRSKK